jgi:hypothetical protein
MAKPTIETTHSTKTACATTFVISNASSQLIAQPIVTFSSLVAPRVFAFPITSTNAETKRLVPLEEKLPLTTKRDVVGRQSPINPSTINYQPSLSASRRTPTYDQGIKDGGCLYPWDRKQECGGKDRGSDIR